MAHLEQLLTLSLSSTELFKAKAYREYEHQSSSLGTLLTIKIRWALSVTPLVLRTGAVQDMLLDAPRQVTLMRPSLVGSSANHTLKHSKQLQNARQPMLLFNSIKKPQDIRCAFVPMEAASGQLKDAIYTTSSLIYFGVLNVVNFVCRIQGVLLH
jgi:hypothetical protein